MNLDMDMDMDMLMNLDFISDFGAGVQTASKYGADAYKIGKTVAPVAGDAWKAVDNTSYDKYAVPATASFLDVKNQGKAAGGWNAVNKVGGDISAKGQHAAKLQNLAQAPVTWDKNGYENPDTQELADYLAW